MSENRQLQQSEKMEEQSGGSLLDSHEKRRAALKRMAKAVIGGAGIMLLPTKKAGAEYVPPVYSRYSSFTTYQHNSYGNYYGNYTNYGSGKYSSYNTSQHEGKVAPYESYAVYGNYYSLGNNYSSYTSACQMKTIYTSGYSSTQATCEYCESNDEIQNFSYTVCYNSTN